MKFQVITKIPSLEDGGNLAIPHVPLLEKVEEADESNGWMGKYREVEFGLAFLNLRQPVFHLGEIIIVNDDGREIVCGMRKADKWDVSFVEFDSIEEAVSHSQKITEP